MIGRKPAIRGTALEKIVIRAPRIFLRLCRPVGADDGDANAEQKYRKPHSWFLLPVPKRPAGKFCFRPISVSGAMAAARAERQRV